MGKLTRETHIIKKKTLAFPTERFEIVFSFRFRRDFAESTTLKKVGTHLDDSNKCNDQQYFTRTLYYYLANAVSQRLFLFTGRRGAKQRDYTWLARFMPDLPKSQFVDKYDFYRFIKMSRFTDNVHTVKCKYA